MFSASFRRPVAPLIGATALAAAVALAACGSSGSAAASPASSGGAAATANAGSAAPTSLTISYSEKVADELPLWIAADAGYFSKQGLKVSLRSISSSQGIPALIGGQTQLASVGGSEMLAADASGATLKYLATLTPVYPYTLFAQSKYKTAASLKGQRIGITSASGSLYVGTVLALKQIGLTPSDVQLVPLGSVTNVNSALLSGTIAAAVSHPPATVKLAGAGLVPLVDLAKSKIPATNVGIAATSAYIQAHPKTVSKVLTAILQGVQREKSDKAFAEKELTKWLGISSQKALDVTYKYYVGEVLPNLPVPTTAQFATSQKALAAKDPGISKISLSSVIDPSLLTKAASALHQ